jgi:hypothetical protein
LFFSCSIPDSYSASIGFIIEQSTFDENDYFCPVKKRWLSVFLLLSFLMVILHGILPHHHHDTIGIVLAPADECTLILQDCHSCAHQEEDHHHGLFGHEHLNECFNLEYLVANSSISFDFDAKAILHQTTKILFKDLSDPNPKRLSLCDDVGLKIISQFAPEANALRGPPSFS